MVRKISEKTAEESASQSDADRALQICKNRGIANVTLADCEVVVESENFLRDAITGKQTGRGGGSLKVWAFDDMVAKWFSKSPDSQARQKPGNNRLAEMLRSRDNRAGLEGTAALLATGKAIIDGVQTVDKLANRLGVSNRIVSRKQVGIVCVMLRDAGKLPDVTIRQDDYASGSSTSGIFENIDNPFK